MTNVSLKKQTLKIAPKTKILKDFIFTYYLDLLKIKKMLYMFFCKYISVLGNKQLHIFCVCVKRQTFCNCLCSCSPSFDSASLIRNIGEFGAKNYFTDHRTANTIQLFFPTKRKYFGPILFQNKL